MKLALRITTLALTVAATMATASAAPHWKTTGGIAFDYGGETYVQFNAHDMPSPFRDRGWLDWRRPFGSYANDFGGPVVHAVIDPMMRSAYFDVNIAYSTHYPEWVGWTIRFFVQDNGTPGRKGDLFRWQWQTGPYAGSDSGWVGVMDGNLVVHRE